MNQIRFRQIARLEQRALPYIKQREGMGQQLRNLHHGAVAHATVLAFLMRYGNPQIGEPLSEACRRVTESEAWRACCEKFPEYCKNFRDESLFEPYDRPTVSLFGDPLRHVFLSTLAGADEKDKLNRVFKSASPWLIWFTFADYTAKLLDLNLPDLATVSVFERSKDIFYGEPSKDIFYGWWGLPKSAFECHPWSDGVDGEPLARTDLSLLRPEIKQDAPITNRQRKRALANSARSSLSHKIDWPGLLSEEMLQLDFETKLARLRRAGHFGGDERRHPEFCGVDVRHRRPRSGY
jgi:hypothetical protein